MTDQNWNYDRTSYILVVDDDNTLLKFFKIHLNKFFSKVIVVKSAKEAYDTLKEKEIDLVISDLRMPRTDGIKLMKKVRRYDASIPFLLVSGALLNEEQQEACFQEADGFLKKPFTVDELHDYISKGMQLREKMKEIEEIVGDRKVFLDLIKGKVKPEKAVSAEKVDKVTELVGEILKKSA